MTLGTNKRVHPGLLLTKFMLACLALEDALTGDGEDGRVGWGASIKEGPA